MSGSGSEAYCSTSSIVPMGDPTIIALAEEKLRLLQEDEDRNKARSKLLDEELAAKQDSMKSLQAQQDERRALIRSLDAEIAKKQQVVNRLTVEAQDRSSKVQPLEEQVTARKQAMGTLEARQGELQQQLKKLDEEVSAKQKAITTLGDHSAEVAQQQRVVGDLLEQQRKLQLEVEKHRKEADEKVARAAAAQTSAELVATQVERQQVQIKMLEKETQEKQDSLEKLKEQVDDSRMHHKDAHDKLLLLECELARQRLEVQLAEEEAAMRRSMLQDLTLQHAQLDADVEGLRRAQWGAPGAEELERDNGELKEQLRCLKQELARARLAVEDKTYKARSLETLVHSQRHRQEEAPLATASALTTHSDAEQRQRVVDLLRRQEDRIARLQHEVTEQEAKVRKSEALAFQEQEMREMVETELHAALAELQLEKGKVQAMQRTFELHDSKISGMQKDLEKGRQQQLLMLMEGTKQSPASDLSAEAAGGPPPAVLGSGMVEPVK